MKTSTLYTTALAAILGLALVGAPVNLKAQAAATTTTSTSTTSTPTATTPTAKTVKKNKDTKIAYKGTVTAVDAKTLTIGTSKKDPTKTETLTLAPTTIYKQGGKDGTLAAVTDVAVGQSVTGSYTKDASGVMTAATVYIKAATPTKPSATTAPTPAAAVTTTPAATPAPAAK